MKVVSNSFFVKIFFLTLFFLSSCNLSLFAQCGPSTPSFTANLIGAPNGTVIVPNVARDDTCCGAIAPDKCIKITIILDVGAMGINFQVYGAVPPGALYYQIGCGPQIAVGTPICLNGQGPHILTFCKPGNNINSYGIISIPAPSIPDSILVRNGCSATLAVSGFSVPTITWNSIYPGLPGAYNGYLNCTTGCETVAVTPTGTPPPYVDYLVGGYAIAPCTANYYQDTVRVYFYQDLITGINPVNTTICFGNNTAVLTATTTGGLPLYTYSWTTGSNSQSVSVGPGTYTVMAFDITGCPPTTATAVVSQFSLPITANIGPDLTLCKSNPLVVLNATVGVAPSGIWSGGVGAFSPNTSALSASYLPDPSEITTGSVQLYFVTSNNAGCPPGYDTLNVFFQNPSSINAGVDQTVCANNNLVTLSGTVNPFPTSLIWSTTGSGTLSTNAAANTTYTPSMADAATGTVGIIITTTNNGVCPIVADTLIVTITPKPIVDAGIDQLICSNGIAVLTGTVVNSSNTGTWSSLGDGTFSPGNSVLSTSYIPGPVDISAGTVSIILTSINNGNCLPESDTVRISISNLAIVNAGLNQLVCSNAGNVNLNGTVSSNSNTGVWNSNGTGAFTPTSTSLNLSYALTANDITNGFVIFTLTSTNNGPCPAVSDSVKINIQPQATVNAGINQYLCSSQNLVALNGLVSGGTSTGSWSANGSGVFTPNNSNLITSYSLTNADITAGFVTFTLTSTNNSVCAAVSDSVKIKIAKLPLVYSGTNQYVCSNTGSIILNGSVSGVTNTGVWASDGTGTFNPGTSVLSTSYVITPIDITNGSVTFTLTSTNNGPCLAVSDTVKIKILQIATVNAGSNQSICSSQNTISLNGSVIGASGTGSWSTNGTGNFQTPNYSLSTIYLLSAADITNGFISFTLNSTNNSPCPLVISSLSVGVTELATVLTGSNQSICSVPGNIALTGTVNGAGNSGTWSGSGTGTYSPGSSALNTSYLISQNDISSGFVSFTLTSTNNGPCAAVQKTVSVSIDVPAIVNAGVQQVICSNVNSVSLSGSIVGSSGEGIWIASGNGQFSPSDTNLLTTYLLDPIDITNGSVGFTLSSTNNGGCPQVFSSTSVVIKTAPSVSVGMDKVICSTLSFFGIAGVISGATNSGYWTTSGSGSFLSNVNALNNTYSLTSEDKKVGSITFILTSTNNDVCPSQSDTLKVAIVTDPVITALKDTAICEKQNPIGITAGVMGGSGNLLWSTSGNGHFVPDYVSNPTKYFFTAEDVNSGSVMITLSAVKNEPCLNRSTSMNLTIMPSAKALFSASSYSVSLPAEAITFQNQSTNASMYYWDFGDGNTSSLFEPSYKYRIAGYRTVTLIADNKNNCSDTIQKQFTIISEVQFPTAFTPNANGSSGGTYNPNDYSNDVFFPFTSGVIEYDLMIFNRWGEVIFHSNDINIGWDGYFNGKICQQDAYVWKADLKFFDGRTYNKTGSVTLLK